MIIGIDHVALSVIDIEKAKDFFLKLGYKIKFNNDKLDNLIIKKQFLNEYQSSHDLCVMDAENCYPIELLRHGELSLDSPTNIVPIFEGKISKSLFDICSSSEKFLNLQLARLKFNKLNFYYDENSSNLNFEFNKLIIQSNKIEESSVFWESFGFIVIKKSKDKIVMLFKTHFSIQKYYLYLIKVKDEIINYLDSQYFNCIAFISSSINADREKLIVSGYDTSDIGFLKVNKKQLKICFIQGPSGEMVELIGFK